MDTITDREALDLRGKTITTFIAYQAASALDRAGIGDVVEIPTEDAAPIGAGWASVSLRPRTSLSTSRHVLPA